MRKTFVLLLAAAFMTLPQALLAQQKVAVAEVNPSGFKLPVFSVENPDYGKSPLTGMTREHWKQAARYLLEGAFSYIHGLDDSMYFPKQLEKTYPRNNGAVAVAKLEGLARTLFVAAPLLKDDPQLTINGISVGDYYLHQIRNLVVKGSSSYTNKCPGSPTQTLLELGSLTMSMRMVPEVLWNPLSKQEKDALAALLKSYGEGPTIDSNWRFFNVFILSFLKDMGYNVNDGYLEMNLRKLLARYRGRGWYNDAPAYDYYSMWAYQTYGPLWAHVYGSSQFPDIARQFMQNQREMADNYPLMFNSKGEMNMWGRSICYRFACVAPLTLLEWGGAEAVNYGWMRRIASSTLLQFITRPDFLQDGVPTMGFYGPFAPCVQIYSCRGSVYWVGKAFFALYLPEDSEFWSATENNGPWDGDLKKGEVYNTFCEGSNLLITNYPDCGASEVRSWCHETVAKDWQKFRSSENYNKLAYNTAFPWVADKADTPSSMNYSVLTGAQKHEVLRLYTFRGYDDGVFRRDAVLETDTAFKFRLTDIPLPNGILRVDKVLPSKATDIHLGHYALPKLDGETRRNAVKLPKGQQAVTVTNGEYSLALIALKGWDSVAVQDVDGVHPLGVSCSYPVATAHVAAPTVCVSLQLWKKGAKPFTRKELTPVKSLKVDGDTVTVVLRDGTRKIVVLK